jgi:hypothetical protein
VHPDPTRAAARERMRRTLARIDAQLSGTRRWIGRDLKLVVLSEYEALAALAQEHDNANARLLVDGLRSYRRRPGMGNLLSRQALDLFAGSFAAADLRRRNGLLEGGKVVVPDRSYFRERQADTIARMAARGVIA